MRLFSVVIFLFLSMLFISCNTGEGSASHIMQEFNSSHSSEQNTTNEINTTNETNETNTTPPSGNNVEDVVQGEGIPTPPAAWFNI